MIATGDAVEVVAADDRITVAVGPACGRCSMCRAGLAEHCDTAFAEANGVTRTRREVLIDPFMDDV